MAKIIVGNQSVSTGNVMPVLNEIKYALNKLIKTGESTKIDLMRLPMSIRDFSDLEKILGVGEVIMEVDTLGTSKIIETKISGVWLITHYAGNDNVKGRMIEVCKVPELLETQAEDMKHGLSMLEEILKTEVNFDE